MDLISRIIFPVALLRKSIHFPLSRFSLVYSSIRKYFCPILLGELEDKVVIITGASSGLGEALSHICYELGSQVVLCGRNVEHLQALKESLLSTETNHPFVEPIVMDLDLTKLNDMNDKVNEILEMCGKVDILINNAGVGYRGEVLDTSVETDIRVMVTNYFGQISLTKAILPYMKAQHYGRIITISSIQGKISIPYRSSYSASKHALQAFFDCLRSEVSTDNIEVLVVSPGYIKTNFSVNAVIGSGTNYGKMDSTTASGMSPQIAAMKIIKAMVDHRQELILAPISNRIAVMLRTLVPSFFFYLMSQRAISNRPACS